MRNRYSPATSRRFRKQRWLAPLPTGSRVTALFRRPLGLPIPHTAIIPRNKARIGANLGEFICTHFLSREQVLGKVGEFDTAKRLAEWLSNPAHATALSNLSLRLAGHSVGALRDERVSQFVRSTAFARLEQIDLARMRPAA